MSTAIQITDDPLSDNLQATIPGASDTERDHLSQAIRQLIASGHFAERSFDLSGLSGPYVFQPGPQFGLAPGATAAAVLTHALELIQNQFAAGHQPAVS